MININYEFRKGIFFIRLIGEINKRNNKQITKELTELISKNAFKYIVINTNYIDKIDLDGLNSIIEICYITDNIANLVVCDKSNIIRRLIKSNIQNINDEIEVL